MKKQIPIGMCIFLLTFVSALAITIDTGTIINSTTHNIVLYADMPFEVSEIVVNGTPTDISDSIEIINMTCGNNKISYIILNQANTTNYTTDFCSPKDYFIIDYVNGIITLNNSELNNSDFIVRYSYNDPRVKGYVKEGIASSFKSLETTSNYVPVIVLAFIIILILSMVIGSTGNSKGNNTAL